MMRGILPKITSASPAPVKIAKLVVQLRESATHVWLHIILPQARLASYVRCNFVRCARLHKFAAPVSPIIKTSTMASNAE